MRPAPPSHGGFEMPDTNIQATVLHRAGWRNNPEGEERSAARRVIARHLGVPERPTPGELERMPAMDRAVLGVAPFVGFKLYTEFEGGTDCEDNKRAETAPIRAIKELHFRDAPHSLLVGDVKDEDRRILGLPQPSEAAMTSARTSSGRACSTSFTRCAIRSTQPPQ